MAQELLEVDEPYIERLTPTSPAAHVAEAILCTALGFSGSPEVAPEGAMDWCLGADFRAPGESIVLGEPLGPEPPPPERLRYFNHACLSCFWQGLRHGGCFALRDEGGAVVAAAAAFPPSATGSLRGDEDEGESSDDVGKAESGLTLPELTELVGEGPGQGVWEHRDMRRRFGLFGPLMEALEERALPPGTPHWYVLNFAVSPTAQGRGHGARLLRWLGRCADHDGVPILLETCGPRNRRFYEGSGFEVGAADEMTDDQTERAPQTVEILSMVRHPGRERSLGARL